MNAQKKPISAQQQRLRPLIFIGFIVVLAILLAVLSTRSALLAQRLGLPFEQQATRHKIIQKVTARQPLSEADGYEYQLYGLPRDRWSAIHDSGFRLPQPGEQISLSNGDLLSVPSYLPEDFEWLGVISSQSLRESGFPTFRSLVIEGANGEPMYSYNRSSVTFLIGGNSSDRVLVLAQIRDSIETGLSLRFLYVFSPNRVPDFANIYVDSAPTPIFIAVDLLLGVVVAPATKGGAVVSVGSQELNETIVSQRQGWWFHGTWNVEDEWDDSDTLTNLIWKRNDYIYLLTGEGITLDDLIKTAESVP